MKLAFITICTLFCTYYANAATIIIDDYISERARLLEKEDSTTETVLALGKENGEKKSQKRILSKVPPILMDFFDHSLKLGYYQIALTIDDNVLLFQGIVNTLNKKKNIDTNNCLKAAENALDEVARISTSALDKCVYRALSESSDTSSLSKESAMWEASRIINRCRNKEVDAATDDIQKIHDDTFDCLRTILHSYKP